MTHSQSSELQTPRAPTLPGSQLPFELRNLPFEKIPLRYDVIDIRPLYNSPMGYTYGSQFLLNTAAAQSESSSTIIEQIKFPKCDFVLYLHSYYENNEEYVLVRNCPKKDTPKDCIIQCDFYNTGLSDITGNFPYATITFSANNSCPFYMLPLLKCTMHLDTMENSNANNFISTADTHQMFINQRKIICSAVIAVMEVTTQNKHYIRGKIGKFSKCCNWMNSPIYIRAFQTFHNNIMVELSYRTDKNAGIDQTYGLDAPNRAARRHPDKLQGSNHKRKNKFKGKK